MSEIGISVCPSCHNTGIVKMPIGNDLVAKGHCRQPGCAFAQLDSCSGDAGERFGQLQNDDNPREETP